MKEVEFVGSSTDLHAESLRACLAAILEVSLGELPQLGADTDPLWGGRFHVGWAGLGLTPFVSLPARRTPSVGTLDSLG